MKIHELFVKPVERPIDGVIKADDLRNLQIELEEYVVTRDVARALKKSRCLTISFAVSPSC